MASWTRFDSDAEAVLEAIAAGRPCLAFAALSACSGTAFAEAVFGELRRDIAELNRRRRLRAVPLVGRLLVKWFG